MYETGMDRRQPHRTTRLLYLLRSPIILVIADYGNNEYFYDPNGKSSSPNILSMQDVAEYQPCGAQKVASQGFLRRLRCK